MMRRLFFLFLMVSGLAFFVLGFAQDENTGLTIENAEVVTEEDAFGIQQFIVEGDITNNSSDEAFTNIQILADVFNADDEAIAEGFGFPVNACGTGLLDFTLQPGASQQFNLPLDVFGQGSLERFEYFPQGEAVEPVEVNPFLTFNGVTSVTQDEVVHVEWIDANTLRYAVGCDADVFSAWQWWEHSIESGETIAVAHPAEENITPEFRQRLELTDDTLFNRSYLMFHPADRRAVYQTDINVMITIEPDGTFKRLLYDDLSRFSLHGYIWLPEGRFLAYYYGAYGDPVRYFTASTSGQLISVPVPESLPSFTIPGVTPDGGRVIITATLPDESGNEVTGYYLKSAVGPQAELLFEAEPPGNNYPAPVLAPQDGGNAYLYVIRPVDGEDRLQCYEFSTGEVHDLTRLPLNLTSDERAWSFLSPDGQRLAVNANGINGGLWLVDLTRFDACSG